MDEIQIGGFLKWMMNGYLTIINSDSMGYLWYFMGKLWDINGGIPKWLVYRGKSYLEMDDLEVPPFIDPLKWIRFFRTSQLETHRFGWRLLFGHVTRQELGVSIVMGVPPVIIHLSIVSHSKHL